MGLHGVFHVLCTQSTERKAVGMLLLAVGKPVPGETCRRCEGAGLYHVRGREPLRAVP